MSGLTQKDLLRVAGMTPGPLCECGNPQCRSQGFSLFSVCHPTAGLKVDFIPPTGSLTLRCHACGVLVVRIAVSPGVADG